MGLSSDKAVSKGRLGALSIGRGSLISPQGSGNAGCGRDHRLSPCPSPPRVQERGLACSLALSLNKSDLFKKSLVSFKSV